MLLTNEQKITFAQIKQKYYTNQKISNKEFNQLTSFLATFESVKEWQAFKNIMQDYNNFKEWQKITG